MTQAQDDRVRLNRGLAKTQMEGEQLNYLIEENNKATQQQWGTQNNYPVAESKELPTIWTTFLVTFFFGLFGLIPAIMHTNRARAAGKPTMDYWGAFALAYVFILAIGVVLFFVVF